MKFGATWKEALTAHGVQPGPAVPDERLAACETQMRRRWPRDLRLLYATVEGLYDTSGEWWVVSPVERVVRDNTRAWTSGELAGDLLAFGDDGTGNPFCIQNEDRVVRWSWIDGAVERDIGDLSAFLAEWTGVDVR